MTLIENYNKALQLKANNTVLKGLEYDKLSYSNNNAVDENKDEFTFIKNKNPVLEIDVTDGVPSAVKLYNNEGWKTLPQYLRRYINKVLSGSKLKYRTAKNYITRRHAGSDLFIQAYEIKQVSLKGCNTEKVNIEVEVVRFDEMNSEIYGDIMITFDDNTSVDTATPIDLSEMSPPPEFQYE